MPPKHRPACGYATVDARNEWLKANGKPTQPARGSTLTSEQLTANLDTAEPLYFWQLYSLLGDDGITTIVRSFYERVFEDYDDAEFRQSFERVGDLEYHIETQRSFWVDAFGGGREYHGSSFRLNFHHEHNAQSVMNAAGATRWMLHMGETLKEQEAVLKSIDPRIPSTIVEFLETKMLKYSQEFNWSFQPGDFDLAKSVDADVSLSGCATTETAVYGRTELMALSIKTLKTLCRNLDVSIVGCSEKMELVDAIGSSPKATVVNPPSFTLASLGAMNISALKQMASCLEVSNVESLPWEKRDIVAAIASCGKVTIKVEEVEKGEGEGEGEEKHEHK